MQRAKRILCSLAVLSLSAGWAWASSPAEDDPGMMDGYRRMQEDEARYRFEMESRRQQGQGSVLDAAAQNDFVTGAIGEGIEVVGSKLINPSVTKFLGGIPADDIGKVLGHASAGDTDGAVRAYATGWVGFLSGTIAGMLAKGAVAGTAVALSAPTATAIGVATVGIGVGYLAKSGFEYLLDMNQPKVSQPSHKMVTPGIPTLPPNVRFTPEQIEAFHSMLDTQARLASPTVAVTPPPASSAENARDAMAKPPALEPSLSAPIAPPASTTPTDSVTAKPPSLDPQLSPPVQPPAPPAQPVPPVTKPATVKTQPASQPAAKPYVVYCQSCKSELALPRGQRVPAACPACGKSKVRIYQNTAGQRTMVGTGDWYWPKNSPSPLRAGQWCE